MPLNTHPLEILYQTDDIYFVLDNITSNALELAILGAIDHARELCALVLDFGPVSPSITHAEISLLTFAWELTGYPRYPPASEQNHEILLELRAKNQAAWGQVPKESQTFNQSGIDACLSIQPRPYVPVIQELTKALEISLSLHPPPGTQDLKLSDLGNQTADILKRVAEQYQRGIPNVKETLANTEILWPYLARGVLRDALGLKRDEVLKKAGQIVGATRERLRSAYIETPLSGRTMKEILELGDRNTTAQYSPGRAICEIYDMNMPESVLHPGASSQAISNAEQRLGVIFPDDYKEFLRISNGIGEDFGFHTGILPGLPLKKVEELEWRDADFELPVSVVEFGGLLYEITEKAAASGRAGCKEEFGGWDMVDDLWKLEKLLVLGEADVDMLVLVAGGDLTRVKKKINRVGEVADGELKKGFERAIEGCAGSVEEWKKVEGIVLRICDGEMTGYRSFRRWLDVLVTGSFHAK